MTDWHPNGQTESTNLNHAHTQPDSGSMHYNLDTSTHRDQPSPVARSAAVPVPGLPAPMYRSSALATQPADHLLIINRFLDCEDSIRLFRCTRRLYDLPLHYRVELNKLALGSYRYSGPVIVESSRQLASFRFCLSNLSVNESGRGIQNWEVVQDAMQLNPRLFSSLKYFSLSFASSSRAGFDSSCLPPGLESLTAIHGPPSLLAKLVPSLPRFSNLKSLSYYGHGRHESVPRIVCPTLKSLTLSGNFDSFVSPFSASALESLPSLRTLDLSWLECRDPLPPFSTLTSLESLILPDCFDQPLTPNFLPASLKSLNLGRSFNHPMPPGSLPPGLESLDFIANHYSSSEFNLPLLPGSLPSSLKTIRFGKAFNQPLSPGVLPSSLRELQFYCDSHFNEPLLPGSLPLGLQTIEFGEVFNQPLLPGVLPPSLTELKFLYSGLFNHPFQPGSLPSNLQSLVLGSEYSHPLFPNILPSSLRHLKFNSLDFFPLPLSCLPPGLTVNFGVGTIGFELKRLPSYRTGQVVYMQAAVASELGFSPDSQFRIMDADPVAKSLEHLPNARLLVEPIESKVSDTELPSRYWVSLLQLRPLNHDHQR
jgi:hypothetical protein